MDGFIIINKPKGITSHDVCQKLIHKLHNKKIGHTGTLDPLATGVVVNAVGKATKLIQYLENQKKTYVATLCFGIDTDTYDILGKITNENTDFTLTLDEIDKALATLKETKEQIPPIYSAIKVNGKKLYDYALKGEEVEIKARPVQIDELNRLGELFTDEDGRLSLKIEIKANKGFYVRSLIHDLGIMLGCYATMTELERTQAGAFSIDVAESLEQDEFRVYSIEEAFASLNKIEVSDYIAKLIKSGLTLDQRQYDKQELFKVYHNDKLIAIYAPKEDGEYKIVVYLGE